MIINMERVREFDIFDKYCEGDNYIYLSVSINDSYANAEKLFNFFFSEETLHQHFTNIDINDVFTPSSKNYSLLYRNLLKFVDDEIKDLEYDLSSCSEEVKKIIENEIKIFDSFSIRRDKAGKIGEYLMSIILEKSFGFNCIIRKSDIITSYNMSVFGIDTIHYDSKNDMIMFGESKFTCNLSNGICLINESLLKYEKRINDEIELIFTPSLYNKLKLPSERFKEPIEYFLDVPTFIKEANISHIGIPLFIAHGEETDPTSIIDKLKAIPKNSFLGLATKYYVVSMPLRDIKTFIEIITIMLKNKIDVYKRILKETKDDQI